LVDGNSHRRGKVMLLRDTLQFIKEKKQVRITELMANTKVSYQLVDELTTLLSEIGLISSLDNRAYKSYHITPEGLRALRAIKRLQKILTPKGNIYLGDTPEEAPTIST